MVWDTDAKTNSATNMPPDSPNLEQQFYSHAERFIDANRDSVMPFCLLGGRFSKVSGRIWQRFELKAE